MRSRIVFIVLVGVMVCSLSSCGSSDGSAIGAAATNPVVTRETILGLEPEMSEKYTLYLGLNDKDTYEQIISTEDALEKANKICAKHAGGYTQLSAKGGWLNDDQSMAYENTIVYIIYDISEKNLKELLDELIKEFNQSAVLVEKSETEHVYYTGE